MTVLPLEADKDILYRIKDIISDNVPVNIDLSTLSSDSIEIIKEYVQYTFPPRFGSNNFACISQIADKLDIILANMQEYDVILAQGDSPNIYVRSMQLLGLSIPQVVIFPLSGIQSGVKNKQLLDNYLSYILTSNNVDNNQNIAFFDVIMGGTTFIEIESSLRRIYENPEFILPKIYYPVDKDFTEDCALTGTSLFHAEKYGMRCVARYPLTTQLPTQVYLSNIFRCNVITVLICLAYRNRLEKSRIIEMPKIKSGKYYATWYDIFEEKIEDGLISISLGESIHAYFTRIKVEGYKFSLDDYHQPITCLLRLLEYYPTAREFPLSLHNKLVTATLIDGVVVTGTIRKNMLYLNNYRTIPAEYVTKIENF